MAVHRNVAAELQAVIHGLTHCRQMGHQTVTVFYDYAGIEQWAAGRWKANTRTTQEYVRFIADCPITITWQKVPAHSGIPMNELVDQLATGAAQASVEHYSLP
jgi:ribonuclease HI